MWSIRSSCLLIICCCGVVAISACFNPASAVAAQMQLDPVGGVVYAYCTFEMPDANPIALNTGMENVTLGELSGGVFTPAVRFGLGDHVGVMPGTTLSPWANDMIIDYFGGFLKPNVPCDFKLKLDLPGQRMSVYAAQRGDDEWFIVAEDVPLRNPVSVINAADTELYPGAMGINGLRVQQDPWAEGEQIRSNPLAKPNRVVKPYAGFTFPAMRSVWQTPGRHVTIQRNPPRWYGFPDVVQTGPTSLVVCYNDGVGHGGGGAVFVKHSNDLGQTWSAPITVHPSGVNSPRIQKLNDGSLLLLADIHGMPYPVVMYDSHDGGYTWTNQRWLNGVTAGGTLSVVPSHVLEMPDGSWLLFASSWYPLLGEEWLREWLEIYISYNRGATWQLYTPQVKTYPPRTLSEPDVQFLPDGRQHMMVRESRGDGWPGTKAYSSDGGRTWEWHFLPFNIAGRMCQRTLDDGQTMATFRNHAGGASLMAWIGDPLDTTQYKAAGAHFNDKYSVGLKDGALHIDSDGVNGQFTQYILRPFYTPNTALDLTFEVKVVENAGRAATFSIPFVGKLRLYPDHAAFAHAEQSNNAVNPDPFERYAPTTNWQPTVSVDSWSRVPWANPGMTAEITANGGYLGTQGLRMGGDWVSGLNWYVVPNVTATPNFTWRYNFRWVPDAGQIINLDCLQSGGTSVVYIQHTPTDCRLIHTNFPGGTVELTTNLPGKENLVVGNWYSAELEHDFTSGMARGRVGPVGGPYYDWTPWVPMFTVAQPTEALVQSVNVDFDNMEMSGVTNLYDELSFPIQPDVFHTYRVLFDAGTARIYLDGVLALESSNLDTWLVKSSGLSTDLNQSGHILSFGNEQNWEISASDPGMGVYQQYIPATTTGYTIWKRVEVHQNDPVFGAYDMTWTPADGFPDQYQLDHMIKVDGSIVGADQGYSGWTQLDDGRIFVVNYTDDTAITSGGPFTALYGAAWIRGTYLLPSDLPPLNTGVINPDPFERYAPTANWQPTAVNDGWSKAPWAAPGMTAEIMANGGYLGTKGLRMGGVWPSAMVWRIAPDIAVLPNFVWKYNFRCVPNAGDIINTNGLQTSYPSYPVMIQTTPTDCRINHGGSPASTDLPGKENLVAGNWYSVEVEHNYTTGQARARFGPAGGSFYDWTPWVLMSDNGQPTMVGVQGVNMEFDNMVIIGASTGISISGVVELGNYAGSITLLPIRVQLQKNGVVLSTQWIQGGQTFSFSGIPSGAYEINISSGKALRKVHHVLVDTGDSINLGTTTLLNGDLNGDNRIDNADFDILAGDFDQVGD